MAGIKETSEVIFALKVLCVQGQDILSGGIGFDDIMKLNPAFDALKIAWEGSGDIPTELQDLDAQEVAHLLQDIVGVAMLAYGALKLIQK